MYRALNFTKNVIVMHFGRSRTLGFERILEHSLSTLKEETFAVFLLIRENFPKRLIREHFQGSFFATQRK